MTEPLRYTYSDLLVRRFEDRDDLKYHIIHLFFKVLVFLVCQFEKKEKHHSLHLDEIHF